MLEEITFVGVVQLICTIALVVVSYAGRDKSKSDNLPKWSLGIALIAIFCQLTTAYWSANEKAINKSNILLSVGPKLHHILQLSDSQISSMAVTAKKLKLNKPDITNEEIKEVLSALPPTGKSHVIDIVTGNNLTWIEYMNDCNAKTVNEIDDIFKLTPYLETQLIKILSDLKNSYHFKEMKLVALTPVRNEDLSFVPFTEYQIHIRKLRDYYEKNIRGKIKETPVEAVLPVTQ